MATLKAAYPQADLEAESARIILWWRTRPAPAPGKPRKRGEQWTEAGIGQGIMGWFARATGTGPYHGDRPRGEPPRQRTMELDSTEWLEGCDNG